MTRLDPQVLFDLLHAHLPPQVREHVLVVGSLAAALTHRDQLLDRGVNTKDCGVVIHPAGALSEAAELAATLFDAGWRPLPGCTPRDRDTSEAELSIVRLNPPSSDAYFVELIALPDVSQKAGKVMIPFEVKGGWYVLPAFRFMALLTHDRRIHNGIAYAAPSMMALANLLAHRVLGNHRVSKASLGRNPLRSAKDLGRVLALARLEKREATEQWPEQWLSALKHSFPDEWSALSAHAGDGLRAVLEDAEALDDALFTVNVGLLEAMRLTVDELRALGKQFIADVIEPLAALASAERE